MYWEEETAMRDVTNTELVVGDRTGREVAAQLDLEEALEASRYASYPYSTRSTKWTPWIEVKDTWELPSVMERYNAADGEGTAVCGIFWRYAGHGHLWVILCFFGVSTNGSSSLSLISATTSMSLSAHLLLRLDEGHSTDGSNVPTLQQGFNLVLIPIFSNKKWSSQHSQLSRTNSIQALKLPCPPVFNV